METRKNAIFFVSFSVLVARCSCWTSSSPRPRNIYIAPVRFLTELSLLILFISPGEISFLGNACEDFCFNMEDHLASKSFPRMSVFLHDVDDEVVVPSEKVVFQPHTVLDKSMVRI